MDREAEIRQAVPGSHEDMRFAGTLTSIGNEKPTADTVIAALRTVFDPEIPVNVYDLGLIYRVDIKDAGFVEIDMTLTAPGCPVAGEMLSQVRQAASGVGGVADVTVKLVFEPPWDKSKMSDEAKLELGLI